jgi:hypothetical protein
LDASRGDRLERFLLILAGACLVASVIFARQGLALIRSARKKPVPAVVQANRDVVLDDQAIAVVASWDDFTEQ